MVFLWVAYVSFDSAQGGTTLFLWLSSLVIMVFVCVLLHEFGHALMAKRYGVKTKDIIITPISGMARLEKLPERPWHEFLVAAAGPLVNLVILLCLGLLAAPFGFLQIWAEDLEQGFGMGELMRGGFLPFLFGGLILTNFILVLFNLIPAFPMDGGRMFRSLLSIPLGRNKATLIATRTAQVIAVLGLAWAVSNGDMVLIVVCVFILLSASQENRIVKTEELLTKHTVGDIVDQRYTRIFLNEDLSEATGRLASGAESNFLVFRSTSEMEVLGVLTQPQLEKIVKEGKQSELVDQHLSDQFEFVSPEMNLREFYNLMRDKSYHILPVQMSNGEIGKMDWQQLNEYLRIQQGIKDK